MIFVGGLSGSGKTTLVQAFVARNPTYLHLGASAILRAIHRPTANLDETQAIENQTALARWLQQLPQATRANAILDGHGTLIVHGRALRVPFEFFRELGLQRIVLVAGDPAVILRNRVWPSGFDSELSIKSLQQEEADALAEVARQLHVSIHEVGSNDTTRFEALIFELLKANR